MLHREQADSSPLLTDLPSSTRAGSARRGAGGQELFYNVITGQAQSASRRLRPRAAFSPT